MPSTFKSWFGVLRLWSLTASTVPVLVGAALAARDGRFSWAMIALTLTCGWLLQVATNLLNTYGDFRSGVDSAERAPTEPQHVTGALGARAVFAAGLAVLALAGTAALTWSLTYFLAVPGQDERFADEAVAGHSRSLLEDHLTDVRSSDPAIVRDWFRSRLDFVVSVKNLSDRGFALVGGRLDYLYDREVAAVVYRRGPAAINLFVWPAAVQGATLRELSDEGLNIALWTEAGTHYCSIGKLDAKELAEFVRAYRAGAG